MPICISKLDALFPSKVAKMPKLESCFVNLIAKVRLPLTWYENPVPQLRSCAALQKIKIIKLRILRCAFGEMLFVPTLVFENPLLWWARGQFPRL